MGQRLVLSVVVFFAMPLLLLSVVVNIVQVNLPTAGGAPKNRSKRAWRLRDKAEVRGQPPSCEGAGLS